MLQSIFGSTEIVSYGTGEILICTAASVMLGLIVAMVYHFMGEGSKGYKVSVIVLPVLVQAVIMMVNGNLGTSVAVLGAFSLVRFRSQPGSSKEIVGVFFCDGNWSCECDGLHRICVYPDCDCHYNISTGK